MDDSKKREFNLLSVAVELHTNHTGSSDSYASWCRGDAGRDEDLSLLRTRLAGWREAPHHRSSVFDAAVKLVLEAAVAEWDPIVKAKAHIVHLAHPGCDTFCGKDILTPGLLAYDTVSYDPDDGRWCKECVDVAGLEVNGG